MAATTQINDILIDSGNWSRPHPMTRAQPLKWFGAEVPKGVTHISMMRSFLDDRLVVQWRVDGDEEIHEMPFEIEDECVLAALAAMKLTC